MNGKHSLAPPSTLDMLRKIKRPMKRTATDRLEWWLLRAFIILVTVGLATAAMGAVGAITRPSAYTALVVLFAIAGICFVVWTITQFFSAVIEMKGGFASAATAIDETIEHDKSIIGELLQCHPHQLRERAKQLELEAKRLSQRSRIATLLVAVGAAVVALHDAGQPIWGRLEDLSLFVLAGSFGLLLGALMVASFAGRLEKISGLFLLAYDRIGSSVDISAPVPRAIAPGDNVLHVGDAHRRKGGEASYARP